MVRFSVSEGDDGVQIINAYFQDKPVGNAEISATPPSLVLKSLFVKPAFEGRGIGTSLLDQVKGEAKKANLPIITGVFEPNGNPERCRRFYKSNGFSIDDEDNLKCDV